MLVRKNRPKGGKVVRNNNQGCVLPLGIPFDFRTAELETTHTNGVPARLSVGAGHVAHVADGPLHEIARSR